jgi:transcription initiation factor TFIID subunit 10
MAENAQLPADSSNTEINEDLDNSLEGEITQETTQPDAMNLDGANDAEPATRNGITETAATLESRIPAKKDATLREFLGKMDDYAPIVCFPAMSLFSTTEFF